MPRNLDAKTFDFSKYEKRHILLKLLYLGWDYDGFVVQEIHMKTIENVLFDALLKTKLIKSRETCNYHRCGRTDKGVSAFAQVISIDVRSSRKLDGNDESALSSKSVSEFNVCAILNGVLPSEIRIYAWAPVPDDFSARFSCTGRIYKYWFLKSNLNLEAMQQACNNLIGDHDMRNICKMDVQNGITSFIRTITNAQVRLLDANDSSSDSQCELIVEAKSFMWHQIRCIVALLFMVGQEKENPKIIVDLFDIEQVPRKPQYTMATAFPLCLFDCLFDQVTWNSDKDTLQRVNGKLQNLYCQLSIKATMVKSMMTSLNVDGLPAFHNDILIPENRSTVHKRLLDRPTCDSFQEQMEKVKRKKKE